MSAAITEIIARAVIRRDGQLLLARQRTKSWSFLPGGHVEPGERVELALVREITEELGTEAKIAGFVGVVEHGYLEDGIDHHELNLVFEVSITDAEPVKGRPPGVPLAITRPAHRHRRPARCAQECAPGR